MDFNSSLAREPKISDETKCLSLNDEPFMIRPTFISLNSVELKYHSFMITLDQCNGSCNLLSQKKVFRKKQKI